MRNAYFTTLNQNDVQVKDKNQCCKVAYMESNILKAGNFLKYWNKFQLTLQP